MFEFPVAIDIGGQKVLLHGLLEAAGIFAGFRYYLYLRKRRGDAIANEHRLWILVGAAFGAVIGARIIGTLENIPAFIASAHRLTYFWTNKTLVGGLFGGLLGVELVKKMIGEKQASGDLFVAPLLLAMMIGRIGCFSAGIYEETYGLPTRLPWGMDLDDGIPRHPVTLYEIAFLLLLWVWISLLRKRYPLAPGACFKLFMIAYFLFRFLLDFIKPGWRYAAGMGTIQLTCLAGLAYYYRYLRQPSLLLKPASAHAR